MASAKVSAQSIIKKAVNRILVKKDYPNRILFSQGTMDIPGIFNKTVKWYRGTKNSYIAYERKVYKNWYAGVRYSKWGKGLINDNEFTVNQHYYNTPDPNWWAIDHTGELESRINYKMLDAYAFYKANLIGKCFNVRLGIAPSYTWGRDVYIKSYVVYPNALHEQIIRLEERKAHYLGVAPQVGGELVVFKNRLSLGIDAIGRYYNGIPHNEYDFMWHVGVNF